MTIPQKPYKKKVISFAILIIKEEKKLYIKINYLNKNIIKTNYALL